MSQDSIGMAIMLDDGTVVMDLRAQSGPVLGDARITCKKGDLHYESVLKHLGDMKPGESKPVPPWPD